MCCGQALSCAVLCSLQGIRRVVLLFSIGSLLGRCVCCCQRASWETALRRLQFHLSPESEPTLPKYESCLFAPACFPLRLTAWMSSCVHNHADSHKHSKEMLIISVGFWEDSIFFSLFLSQCEGSVHSECFGRLESRGLIPRLQVKV